MQKTLTLHFSQLAPLVLMIIMGGLWNNSAAQDASKTQPEVMPVLNTCAIIEDRTERETCSNQAIMEHIMKKLIYPEDAKNAGIEGTVMVKFVVDTKGQVTGTKVMKGPKELSKAAIQVVQELPGFVPGTRNGKPVDTEFVLPIRFALSN